MMKITIESVKEVEISTLDPNMVVFPGKTGWECQGVTDAGKAVSFTASAPVEVGLEVTIFGMGGGEE